LALAEQLLQDQGNARVASDLIKPLEKVSQAGAQSRNQAPRRKASPASQDQGRSQ